MKITKAVIPVAGLGTRMLPATKAIPKEMLPVVDKPLIQYVVEECINAGIKTIILVTHSSKISIENHFDKSFELETTLEKRVKRQLLEEIQSICPADVKIFHIRQGEAKGLGHAIQCAKPMLNNQPFAIVLPDVLLNKYSYNPKTQNLAEMIKLFEQTGISQILVDKVPMEQTKDYGIVNLGNIKSLNPGECTRIIGLIEKPDPSESPSDLAVVGRYVLSEAIWPLFAETPLGAGDEFQLTDTLMLMLQQHLIHAYAMHGTPLDCGSKIGYLKAIVEYAAQDEKLKDGFIEILKDFVDRYDKIEPHKNLND